MLWVTISIVGFSYPSSESQQHIYICGVVYLVYLQSSDSQPRGGDSLSRQQSYSTITAAQLAAALASATGEIHVHL
jgi:hypothetical protein